MSTLGAEMIAKLPEPVQVKIKEAITDALHLVFIVAAGATFTAFIIGWFLKHVPLKRHAGAGREKAEAS